MTGDCDDQETATDGRGTRKHLYLVTEHYNEDRVGTLKITDTRREPSKKNHETTHHVANKETMEMHETKVVSCGYIDFLSEESYENASWGVFLDKVAEIDNRHLEKAGLDPAELFDVDDGEDGDER